MIKKGNFKKLLNLLVIVAIIISMTFVQASWTFADESEGSKPNCKYTVKYLQLKVRDRDPDVEVAKTQVFTGEVGDTITVEALDIPGWIPDAQTKELTLEEGKNEIEFRYELNVGLLLTGKGVNKDIYYTRSELETMADDEQNMIRNFSVMKRGGIPAIIMGKGLDLVSFINRADVIANEPVMITGKAVDGWVGGSLNYDPTTQSFDMDYYYYPNIFTGNNQGAQLVHPMLVFYNVENLENVPEIPTTKDDWREVMNFPNPTLMHGQASIEDYNNQNFGKMLMTVQVGGTPSSILAISGNGLKEPKQYRLDEILRKGLESKTYGSNNREGISLSRILSDAGIIGYSQIQIKTGNEEQAVTISSTEAEKFLLSINVKDNIVDKRSPLCMYYEKDGVEAVIENVTGIICGKESGSKPVEMPKNIGEKDNKGTDSATLTDIKGHWAEEFIKDLINSNAIKGYPDNTFKPNNNITRAEFATVLVKAFKLEDKSGKVFTDTQSHWAKEFIATAAANGIVSGYNENTFGPDDLITREQMAVMIAKTAEISDTDAAVSFTDSKSISNWAKSAVAASAEYKIILGYPDGTFKPQGKATRAEAVTVIVKSI